MLAYMQKKQIIIVVFVTAFVLAGIGGYYIWKFQSNSGNTVILRDDLPPTPKGYDVINKDPVVSAEIPTDRAEEYMKNFEEALAAVREHPDSFLGWTDIGGVKSTFGDYKGAEEAWLYAGVISPKQPRSFMNLGDLYWNKLKNYERAEWAYRSAIEREKTLTVAYRDLASLYHFSYTQKKDQATNVLMEGVEANPDDAKELIALAALWAMQDGRTSEAINYYEQFLILDPDNAVAKEDLARLRAQKR